MQYFPSSLGKGFVSPLRGSHHQQAELHMENHPLLPKSPTGRMRPTNTGHVGASNYALNVSEDKQVNLNKLIF